MALIAAWPAHAAIAHVQTVTCVAEGSTTCTTDGVTTTTGHLVVLQAAYCCAAFTSFTDSQSNSWASSAIAETPDDGAVNFIRVNYNENISGNASHTFTLNGASSAFFGTLAATEISGESASPLDQTATGTDALTTSHTTDPTGTTAQANELLLGVGTLGLATTFTTDTGAGWTERANISTDVDTEGILVGTKIVSATSAYTYTYTTGTTSGSLVTSISGISTWKEAAGGVRQRCIGCGVDKKVIGE